MNAGGPERSNCMKTYDIRDFGAVADGVTMNTEAIQAAIENS